MRSSMGGRGSKNRLYCFRRAHRVLFSTTIVGLTGCQLASRSLNPVKVTGFPGPQSLGFGGVFTERNTIAAAARQGIKPRLISRQLGKIALVPYSDALGGEIHDRHLDLWAAIWNHSPRRATHTASNEASRCRGIL